MHASRIMPIARIPADQLQVALDLVYDRRSDGYDPLARSRAVRGRRYRLAQGQPGGRAARAAAVGAAQRRIIDGERIGLEADLDEALASDRRWRSSTTCCWTA